MTINIVQCLRRSTSSYGPAKGGKHTAWAHTAQAHITAGAP